MSAKSKTRSKDARKKKKAAMKAAKRATYESYKNSGKNTKSKRFVKNSKTEKKASIRTHSSECGNAGCTKCYGIKFRPFLVKGTPVGMPQWMYQKWLQAA